MQLVGCSRAVYPRTAEHAFPLGELSITRVWMIVPCDAEGTWSFEQRQVRDKQRSTQEVQAALLQFTELASLRLFLEWFSRQ